MAVLSIKRLPVATWIMAFRYVDASFVVAHEAAPAREPAEGALNHPTPRQHLQAGLGVDAARHFDEEIEETGLVQHLPRMVGTVGLGEIGWITFRLPLDPGHRAPRLCPHTGP